MLLIGATKKWNIKTWQQTYEMMENWKKINFPHYKYCNYYSYILHKENSSVNNAWCSAISNEGLLSSLSRVLEETFKHHLDDLPIEFRRDLQGGIFWTNWLEESILFIASEFVCRPWEKRTRRCIQMTSFKWRQCNASLCIFSGFEIRHTKKVFLLAFNRTELT